MLKTCFLILSLLMVMPACARADWFARADQVAYQSWKHGDCKAAISQWSHSAYGMFGRGVCLMRMKRFVEAEQAFNQAVEVAGRRDVALIASARYNMGNSLYAQGRLKAAAEAWQLALGLNPAHAHARHNLKLVQQLLAQKRKQGVMSTPSPHPQKIHYSDHVPDDSHREQGATMQLHAASHHQAKPDQKSGGERDQSGGVSASLRQRDAMHELAIVHDSHGSFLAHRIDQEGKNAQIMHQEHPW